VKISSAGAGMSQTILHSNKLTRCMLIYLQSAQTKKQTKIELPKLDKSGKNSLSLLSMYIEVEATADAFRAGLEQIVPGPRPDIVLHFAKMFQPEKNTGIDQTEHYFRILDDLGKDVIKMYGSRNAGNN
jgi:hypothetical protein